MSPSCGISVNETGAHDFIAFRSIDKGKEITFDYAIRNYSIKFFPNPCLCEESVSRKSDKGWKGLSSIKILEHKGFITPYLLEMDRN